MAADDVAVVNGALRKLGEAKITALSDDVHSARVATDTYSDLLDAMLSSHPWNFAIDRAELAADGTDPEWEYSSRYAFPDGVTPAGKLYCLRVLDVNDLTRAGWEVEGRFVVTDLATPIEIKYIGRHVTEADWPGFFTEAFEARLAMEWAEPFTKQPAVVRNMSDLFVRKMREARAMNGQERSPRLLVQNTWTSSRNP